jgi:pyruvate kinase
MKISFHVCICTVLGLGLAAPIVAFQLSPLSVTAFTRAASTSTARKATIAPNGASSTPPSSLSRETTVAAAPKIAQRWRKSTKQVITLGPASDNREMIEKLFLAGADVFRLNFSHGSQEQKKELLDMIREVEEKYSHPICVLGDLQGPKLRVGEFSKEFEILVKGQTFRLDYDSAKGDNTRVMLPHPEILAASQVGHSLLVDDGKVKLTVIGKAEDNTWLDCRVDVPGKISNRKVRVSDLWITRMSIVKFSILNRQGSIAKSSHRILTQTHWHFYLSNYTGRQHSRFNP